jgi:hypothetical protein
VDPIGDVGLALVVEKRGEISTLSRATVISTRSMEIFRRGVSRGL